MLNKISTIAPEITINKPKHIQTGCDHIAGYIGRQNEPFIKLLKVSEFYAVNVNADKLEKTGFAVTVFPYCPVCGIKILAGSYQPKEPVNGKVVR